MPDPGIIAGGIGEVYGQHDSPREAGGSASGRFQSAPDGVAGCHGGSGRSRDSSRPFKTAGTAAD